MRQLAQTRLSQLQQAVAAQRAEILRLERQTELLTTDDITTEEEVDRILAEVDRRTPPSRPVRLID